METKILIDDELKLIANEEHQFNLQVIEEHLQSLSVEEIKDELGLSTNSEYSDNKQKLVKQLLDVFKNNLDETTSYATEIEEKNRRKPRRRTIRSRRRTRY